MIDGLHDGTPYFLIQSRCLKTSAINQKTTNQQCLNFEIPKIVSIFVHTPYVDSGWHPELEKSFNVHCMFFHNKRYTSSVYKQRIIANFSAKTLPSWHFCKFATCWLLYQKHQAQRSTQITE